MNHKWPIRNLKHGKFKKNSYERIANVQLSTKLDKVQRGKQNWVNS